MFEVLFLIITGILLIVLNYKAVKKEQNSFSRALNEEKSNLGEYELELGRLKNEFSEDVAKLQSEILKLQEQLSEKKGSYVDKMAGSQNEEPVIQHEIPAELPSEDTSQAAVLKFEQALMEAEDNVKPNNIKINEIKSMLDKNISMDEIAQKLNMGKGELLLIKELYIK